MYDIIIIGAGPSGSSCAYRIKKLNPRASVLLIDKMQFPRDKPCGGGISPDVMHYLDFNLRDVMSCESRELQVIARGKTIKANCDMIMVRRQQFDDFLLKKAMEKGVATQLGCEVIDIEQTKHHAVVKTNQGDYTAKIAVIAEGGAGKLAKKLQIAPRHQLAAALEYEHYQVTQNDSLQINFDQNETGYAWIFPKADGLSMGVGRFSKNKHSQESGLPQQLKKYLHDSGVQDIDRNHWHGHPVQLYSGRQKLVHHRIMLIGEVAGCVDPLTAEGIRPAIKSGYHAATLLAEAVSTNNLRVIKKYNRLFHQMIGKDFQYARFAAFLLFRYFEKILPVFCTQKAVLAFANVFSGNARYADYVSFKKLFLKGIMRYFFKR